MSEVYRARDERLDREVAIKVLAWHDVDEMNYPMPVAVTWEQSFEELRR